MRISLDHSIHSSRDRDENDTQTQPAGAENFGTILSKTTASTGDSQKTAAAGNDTSKGTGFAGDIGTTGHSNDKTPGNLAAGTLSVNAKTGWAFAQGPGFAGDFGTSGHSNDK